MGFAGEIWTQFRPYLKNRVLEFLEAATLWFGLYFIRLLTVRFRVGGWVESFVVHIHEVSTVVAFLFIAYYGVKDKIKTKRK
jgi:hypothetical protein